MKNDSISQQTHMMTKYDSPITICSSCHTSWYPHVKARIFLLVDLRDFFFQNLFSDFGSRGRTKNSSENDQLAGHFQSFFFNISRTNK